jgi:hypothetical protein
MGHPYPHGLYIRDFGGFINPKIPNVFNGLLIFGDVPAVPRDPWEVPFVQNYVL